MRSHNDEHSDSLPSLDISAMRHVAYVFDALIYYMRSGTDSDTDVIRDGISVISCDHDENENEEQDDDVGGNGLSGVENESLDGDTEMSGKSGKKHSFFHRSESTIFLGCPPPDPFKTPLVEALPLADQPHLLHPNSRREDLFGMARQTVTPVSSCETKVHPPLSEPWNLSEKVPVRMALASRLSEIPASAAGQVTAVPGCSAAPPISSVVSDLSFSSASVIVKPLSHLPSSGSLNLGSSQGTSRGTLSSYQSQFPSDEPMNLSSHDSSSVETQSQEQKTEVQQASVIVHAGSSQSSSKSPVKSERSSSHSRSQSSRSDETPCSMDTIVTGSLSSESSSSQQQSSSTVSG